MLEDNVGSLERNVSENVKTNASVGLQTTEAGGASRSQRGVSNVASGDSDLGSSNEDVEGGKSGAATNYVSALH